MNRYVSLFSKYHTQLVFSALALLTVCATVLRTLAFFNAFDADIGYFRTGGLTVAVLACSILSVAACVAVSFLINKEHFPEESNALSPLCFIGTAIAALLLCATVVFLLIYTAEPPAPTALPLLCALCLFGGAVHFLLRLLGKKTNATVIAGIVAILGAMLVLAITYFDRYTQMNAPHKLSLHLCMLAVMFALLYEQRALLGRALPRAHLIASCISAHLCTVFAISNIIAFIGGAYDDLLYLFLDLAALGFAVYFTCKSVHFALSRAETEVST